MSATSGPDPAVPTIPHYKLPWSKSFTAPAGSPGHRRLAWPPVIAALAVATVGVVIMLPGKPLPTGAPIAERSFRIDQQPGGVISMLDAKTGAPLLTLEKDGDGFMRGVLHSIALQRATMHISQETPLELAATAGGRLLLSDPPTRTKIDLEAFGSANEAAFARLLPGPVKEAFR